MTRTTIRHALAALAAGAILGLMAVAAHAQIYTVEWHGDYARDHWVSVEKFDGVERDEIARSYGGADVLEGRGGDDDLHGGSGPDILKGGPGNDNLYPGVGRDHANGGMGADLIDTVDGHADDVNCGPGFDTVIVDELDTVAADCEEVA